MSHDITPGRKLSDDERTAQLCALGLIEPWEWPTSPPRRKRKKNQSSIIKRALRAALRAGVEPTGFRVGNNGEVTVFTKKVAEQTALPTSEFNEWDEVNGAA